jgi:formate C-acetyltransferase
MEMLKKEMVDYYRPLHFDVIDRNTEYNSTRLAIEAEMEEFLSNNPSVDTYTLKARLYQTITDHFTPVIFPHSPFFYEMGVRFAENWGNPDPRNPGSWVYFKHDKILKNTQEWENIWLFTTGQDSSLAKMWAINHGFDFDHHCLGYTHLLDVGLNGILKELQSRRESGDLDASQQSFLIAAETGCRCMIRIAEKFTAQARMLLAHQPDPQAKRFLMMIAEAATHVPANPPRNFYEGLAMTWFLREASASLEGIGISVIGHIDRQLIGLYHADIRSGRLTQEEASDLLARWMLPTDVKFHIDKNPWPETSTCLMLGGCDADGLPIYNDLTRLIIETHCKQRYLNPKLNCRFSGNSSQEYLELLSDKILEGNNNFALLNDDLLIPACIKAGKTLRHARGYVNGGCQETMVEGEEHSAGAYYYFNMPSILTYCIQGLDRIGFKAKFVEPQLPEKIDSPVSFEVFYTQFMDTLKHFMTLGAQWSSKIGRNWQNVNPCPLFSSSIDGCIENATDYSAGGARYNPSGLALVGLGTIVDSMLAVRHAVFEQKICTYEELVDALRGNWAGMESLRRRMIAAPKFGHEDIEADKFTAKVAQELAGFVRTLENERGDHFQPSMFVYYAFKWFGNLVKATPDGRRDGDLLSQGTAPGRLRYPESLTQIFNSMAVVDYTDFPGNAVLDLQLPAGRKFSSAKLAAIIRTFGKMKLPTLQPNCVDAELLRDAMKHPQNHPDLTVRISGLSAKFVCLDKTVQQEIIDRITIV